MSVLILKNVFSEGPGTIEDFLSSQAVSFRIVDLSTEDFPTGYEADTLVMLGGPMSVNDADDYPYIAREEELTREFIAGGKKVLGVCLGAQIMAKALGSRVYPGPEKEIGWLDIEIVGRGGEDPVMAKLAAGPSGELLKRVKVFHWHGETFDLPSGAERLARSDLYANQAFRYGKNAYAFQFHVEVREETIYEWMKDEPVDKARLKKETDAFYRDCLDRAYRFYEAFFITGAGQ
jgi:GMP synthase-like glutamine amidotransferase